MDADDADPGGLLGIALSDSEPNDAERRPGGAQSEEDFQAVRKTYRVKMENGEIWKSIALPPGGGPRDGVAKPEARAVLHAVEELYFFGRFEEGAAFARKALGGGGGGGAGRADHRGRGGGGGGSGGGGLDEDTARTLRYYETKCVEKRHGRTA